MKSVFLKIYIFFGLFVGLQACTSYSPPVIYALDDTPPIDDTLKTATITWDKAERKISHEVYFAEYGRVKRYSGDTLLMVYHFGPKKNEWDNIALRKSFDNGKTWQKPQIVVADDNPEYYGFATPDLLVLKNKWLVLAYTGKGKPDDSLNNNLQIKISKDKGQNWSKPKVVALGRSWEPGMLQLPNGEIQLFFSNEILSSYKAKGRHEQQVLLITSKDNGTSWDKPKRIAFTNRVRDGMPVPLLLQQNKGIVVALETVENNISPEIIWTSLKANWKYKDVGTIANGRRWYGTVDPVWGGAPCLVQLPNGLTVLSMQTEGGRKIDRYKGWKKNTVVVMVGNSLAKNFGSLSFPYPDLKIDEGRYFCSLFVTGPTSFALITTRNYPNGRSELFWKEATISLTN